MIRPGRDGRDAFARFLTSAAGYRDLAQLQPYLRQPATVAYLADAPHDCACVDRLIGDLMLAMVQTEEIKPTR